MFVITDMHFFAWTRDVVASCVYGMCGMNVKY